MTSDGTWSGSSDAPGVRGVHVAEALSTRVVETHISRLFFVGDRVYKMRKPVRFPFADFSDRRAREADCHREVALNRRLAPDVYLGVADVELNGEAIDHMVVMQRMSETTSMAALAVNGDDLSEWTRRVVERLVPFHDHAKRSPHISEAASAPALRDGWMANFAEIAPFVGPILPREIDDEIQYLALQWLSGRSALLDRRIDAGRICDGHGDLQADDIFCLDGTVEILDCLEFSDELRYSDVCADVAFLAMDLQRLGRPDAARQFLEVYQDLSGDRFPQGLVHHYCAQRAYVRAKVACLRASQGNRDADALARQLHRMVLAHLRRARVCLVIVGGLPGSGKSTLAQGLSSSRGWTMLRSDDVRHEVTLADEAPGHGYRKGRYAPQHTASVYQELLVKAGELLQSGDSVLLDASWSDAQMRLGAQQLAQRTSSDTIELCCTVNRSVAEGRIEARRVAHHDPSEATIEVRDAMAPDFDEWPTASVVDTTTASPSEALEFAESILNSLAPTQ